MTLLQRLANRLNGAHDGTANGHNGNGHNGNGVSPNGNGHAPSVARLAARLATAPPPRILILSVSAGTGHMRAAEAVELALRQLVPEAHIRNVDILQYSTPPFRRCYGRMYVDFIDLAPQVLGFFYNLMDRPSPGKAGLSGWDRLRIFLEKMNMRSFIQLLQAEPWDLVISTHFLSGEIIAALAREDRLHLPHVMVTTDFETHRLWVNQPCAHYFTATEEAALYLETFGVPSGHATAVGIPIHPVFAQEKDRAECLARQGLRGDRPIILQLSGGNGVGPIHDLYKAIIQVEEPVEVVVVTAHNARAKRQLEATPVPPRHRSKILGFTKEIDELMRVADLIVTKPGGLTTSEILAVGGAMVIVDPVPGQEERNSDYLLENGAAIKINHLPTMAHKLTALLRDPERLAGVRTNAQRLGRPRAAFDVVERSLEVMLRSETRRRHVQHQRGRIRCELPARLPPRPQERTPGFLGRLRRAWRASPRLFDFLTLLGMGLFSRLWHRCKHRGSCPIPEKGPAIVVANHPSHADPAFLLATSQRLLCFLHARENFEVFLLRRFFRRIGCIPVNRNGRDVGAVRRALQCLEQGRAVCVFPEGDVRPEVDSTSVRHGAAFLALKSRAPVYPALIAGGPRHGGVVSDWLFPSRGVRVLYGPPLDLSAYHGQPIDQPLLREVSALIMQSILDLQLEINGPRPPEPKA